MEILKKIKPLVPSLIFAVLSIQAFAQDYEKVQHAFQESYRLEESGQYIQATEMLKTVYDEDSYEINLRLGWLSYSVGNFMESMAYYQKSISLKPMAIEARLGLTMPASAAGNWETVRQQYTEVLKIDPMNARANYYLGMIYYNREQYDEAYKHFEKVANLYPFDYDGMLMYAWTNYKLGKLREARVLFNKVLMISPGDESASEGLKLIQ